MDRHPLLIARIGGDVELASLDVGVFIGYVIALLAIGGWVSYRQRHSDDLFLGGRSMGWGNVGFSIFGTNIGPNFLIATCGAGYTTGMVTANFEWMAWVFLFLLGMVFVPFYMATRISTMPGFLKKRFGAKCYTFMTFYALFGTVVLWIGGTLFAGGSLLSQLMGWNETASIWALAAIATSFTVAGGLAAVMVTDSFQSVLMIIGSGTLAVIAMGEIGSFEALQNVHVRDTPPELTWKLFHPADSPTPWYAFVLGYPVLSLWFWCSDQTIVQRALGARDLRNSQAGTLLCGFLKILPPFIFLLPGICAAVLMPGIQDDKEVFLRMVDAYLGPGLKGLTVAVLVAAVVSTLNSGLNSFSTVYTLDVHQRWFARDQSEKHAKRIGRVTTLAAALMAVGIAAYLKQVQESGGLNLFDLFQSIIGYMAPPVSAVFVLGIFWKRATATAAFLTLLLGSTLCLGIGIASFNKASFLYTEPSPPAATHYAVHSLGGGIARGPAAALPHAVVPTLPGEGEPLLPHFLVQSFLLFCLLAAGMVAISLATNHDEAETALPSLRETYATGERGLGRAGWWGWAALAGCMAGLYGFFQFVM